MPEEGRLKTGTKGLDEMLYGGVPIGNCFILQGPPGNEKELLANQYIKEGLLNGECVFAVLATVSPDEFRQQLKFIGVNPRKYEQSGDLRIVDWYSYKNERVKSVEEGTGDNAAVIKASFDLTNVGIAITKTIEALPKEKKKRAVITLLSPALNSFGLRTVYNFAQATRAKCRDDNITTIFVLDSEAHEIKVLSTFHQIFDGLIEVSRTREGPHLRREICILSMSGTPIVSEYLELQVEVNSISVRGVEKKKREAEEAAEARGVPTLDDIFAGFLESEQRAEAERASLATSRADSYDVEAGEVEAEEEEEVDISIFCPECAAVVQADAMKCQSCGADFEEEEEVEIIECPNCSGMVKDEDMKCPHCGVSFDEEEERPAEAVIGEVMVRRGPAPDEVGPIEEGDAEVWDDEPEMELGGGADEEEVINPRDELMAMLEPWKDQGYDLDYFYEKIEEDTRMARKEVMIFVSRARELSTLEKRITRLKAKKLEKDLSALKTNVTSPDKSKRGGIEWSILELRGKVKQVARRRAQKAKARGQALTKEKRKVVKKKRR
jgi:KaiC/GvpD/RAD55 family RecA-like ATPase